MGGLPLYLYSKSKQTKTNDMNTYKLNFTNTANKFDFVLIDAINEGQAIDLFIENAPAECMISIQNVTGKFVDTNGNIK